MGKTTVLEECLGGNYSYVTLEDPRSSAQAEDDALLFFQANALPLVIDEVQRVPSLLQTTKFIVDHSAERGQVVLTGSQTYALMKGVSESLAGRIGILEMSGISLRELLGRDEKAGPYIPRMLRSSDLKAPPSGFDLWAHMQRGEMSALCATEIPWDRFWTGYIQSYLERDVRDLINLKSERKFFEFMVAAAARTGQLFNASDIANAIDVDYKTVQSWVSILQASGIAHILYPFWPNVGKRLTKTPQALLHGHGTRLQSHAVEHAWPASQRGGCWSRL